ncbi:MAG: PDDEXK nuclease domain-containing protein [Prevotellaceae bacterium]|jgi:predicted nuclease of restriction endonuclease-like (RecB) superfamily|nr:PDDEXK nuclease domain-containing protein [Prevotellaceae bacterium]
MNRVENNLYRQIADLLSQAKKATVRAVNYTMVCTYYEIGRMIVEDEQQGAQWAAYGRQVLKELSEQLTKDFGRGFSETNLKQMRSFYLIYSKNQIRQTMSDELQNPDNGYMQRSATTSRKSIPHFRLSWSHYVRLMRIENVDERKFYEIESVNNNWSLRELQRQFDSALYERLALSRDKEKIKELSIKGHVLERPQDAIKDPFVLEFLDLPELAVFSETELEQQIINKLEHFLLELGKGFTFVGRQVRFTFDEKHFKVDLVFYNRLLKCFVIIDLKIGELTHQDLGQLQMYVNYYDRFVKLEDENKTIVIILCKEKNNTLVEITLPQDNTQLFAGKYQTVLPSKEELKRLIDAK